VSQPYVDKIADLESVITDLVEENYELKEELKDAQ